MPLDVAKTIAQKQQGSSTRSTFSILRSVLRTSGVAGIYLIPFRASERTRQSLISIHRGVCACAGLYAGLAARLMRVGLDRAFGFLAYEWIVEWLEDRSAAAAAITATAAVTAAPSGSNNNKHS